MRIVYFFVIAYCVLFQSINAQTLNSRAFIYDGVVSEPYVVKQNPSIPAARGWNFTFWGVGNDAGCAGAGWLNDGPIKEASSLFDFLGDTGISQGALGNNFTPSSNSPNCADKTKYGQSHAHFKNVSDAISPAGIGLFTASGPLIWKQDELAYFQPPGPQFPMPYVQGQFLGYSCASSCMNGLSDPKNVFPFSGSTNDFDKLTLVFNSSQTLRWLYLENPNVQQTRQQMQFDVASLSNGASIQFLFANAWRGTYAHADLNTASVWMDPVQGNLSAVDGPLGENGQTTNYIDSFGNSYPLWASWGSPTLYDSTWSGIRTYQAEITFNQFLVSLRLATADYLRSVSPSGAAVNPASVTDAQIAARYGADFKNPMNWVLTGVAVAHESYNPLWQTSSVVTGGGFTTLKVLSLP